MERDLRRLADDRFDVVVVGGGITGALVAWDATLRGLSVALVEKGDFGEATSAASSKLIHGGIRYLQQGLLGKVRESLMERRAFLRVAPHLLRAVPFLVPTHGHGLKGKAVLGVGMTLYEMLGVGRNVGLPASRRVEAFRVLSRREALAAEPLLTPDGLTGAVVFPEIHMHSSERMTLAFVASAAARGCAAANHAEVTGFLGKPGRVEGVRLRDRLDGGELDLRARLVVNAAGPWALRLLARRPGASGDEASRMAHSKGCHVVLDPLTNGHALALATRMANESLVNRGGRHIFLIPWRGRTLVGTTNVPHAGAPDDLEVTDRDIDDFLVEIRSAVPRADVTRERVRYAFGGLYPLVDTEVRENVYQGSGRYRIWDHARTDGTEGLVTVLGAKYTTARRAAEAGVDRAVARLGDAARPCTTATTPVDGGDVDDREALVAEAARALGPIPAAGGPAAEEDAARELVYNHGTAWRASLDAAADDPSLRAPVAPDRPTLAASVRWAVREEMACRLADVVFRRTGLGTIGRPGGDALHACARILASELGWSAARLAEEVASVESVFARVT